MNGDEVVQVYARPLFASTVQPIKRLVGFARVAINVSQTMPVEIAISLERLRIWDEAKKDYVVQSGSYELGIGAASDDVRVKTNLLVK